MKLRALWVVAVSVSLLGAGIAVSAQAEAKAKAKAERAVKKPARKAKAQKLVLKLTELNKKTKNKELKALRKSVRKVKGVMTVKPQRNKGLLVIRHRADADVEAIRAAVSAAGFTIGEAAAPQRKADPLAADAEEEAPADAQAGGKAVDDDLPEDF